MKRRIDLLNENFPVTVFGQPGQRRLKVGHGAPESASLTMKDAFQATVHLGDVSADIQMAVKGEKAYIRAFDRTFTLQIVDPVEQAAQEAGGGSDTARAPMPGTVGEIQVAVDEPVTKGQPMITIESMKILMVIAAPRDGVIDEVHFGTGDTFGKNAVLVSLKPEEEN